jgi:tetratricopeptide (TPR) repeat protein
MGDKNRFTLSILIAVLVLAGVFPQAARDAQSFYTEARSAMASEDWYSAAEDLLEALQKNPAHSEAARSLAECYYELSEYDQALVWVRKARQLSRLNIETENLEAFILIALGKLKEADSVIKNVLGREPYNREALFAAAELDIARGRAGDAAERFKSAVKLYPDDRRILVSLALVLGALGDYPLSSFYIERAEAEHPDDYRVFYYAAYLESMGNKISAAIRSAERSLGLRENFAPARDLLGVLRYRNGDFNDAMRIADESIRDNRNNAQAWFLKGMSLWRLGRFADARSVFENSLSVFPDDEFIRTALENILIADSPVESAERKQYSNYHFKKAASYKKRSMNKDALFEYRRGLRINPYADDRKDYADVLKVQGYSSLYLDELKFMQDLGKGDRAINDAVETYNAMLSTSLARIWNISGDDINRHWNVAVFSVASQSGFYHTDASYVAASYIKDILVHSTNINVQNLELRAASFAAAFRNAREDRNCDYFMIISVGESERDISIKANLYVTRTGAKAAEFFNFRTGQDRLRNASNSIVEQLSTALPFRASLIRREAGSAIIDKGKIDGVADDAVFDIIKKGKLEIKSEGIGYKYLPADIIGSFAVNQVAEEITLGTITRQGYFDSIALNDEIILKSETNTAEENSDIADPELRSLLMKLR